MRKLILVAVVALMTASVSMANPYSPDLATIQGMGFAWNGGSTTSTGLTVTNEGTAIRFQDTMQFGAGNSDGLASMGIGYPWPTSPPVNNLSAYNGYALTFLNTNNSRWSVNLYMNTGWTDAPYGDTDHFYQSSWVALLPGQSTTVMLDFASADTWLAGVDQGLTAVVNANHVTNIGFQVSGNMDTYPSYDLANPSNPDAYHIDVSQTIPAPGAILLGGIGVSIVGWMRRRRTL